MFLHLLTCKYQAECGNQHVGLIVPYAFHHRVGKVHLESLFKARVQQVYLVLIQYVKDVFPFGQTDSLLSCSLCLGHGLLTADIVLGIKLTAFRFGLDKFGDTVEQRAGQCMY